MYHDYNLTELDIPSSWADISSEVGGGSLRMVRTPIPIEFTIVPNVDTVFLPGSHLAPSADHAMI